MHFEIPFNEETSKKQSNILFNLYWNKAIKENKKNLYGSVIFILLGALIVYGNGNVGYLFILIGFCYLLIIIRSRISYKKRKKIFAKTTDEHITEYKENNSIFIYQFLEEWFCYTDYKLDLKIKWKVIKSYKLIDDTILLEAKDNIIVNFLLGKEEVGSENFEKILVFINSKIKKDGNL